MPRRPGVEGPSDDPGVNEARARDQRNLLATLALSSGVWFLSFALMQLPVGWALDRIGPRLTAAVSQVIAACP